MADDPRQQQLQQELADCVMGASWLWCVAGVAAAVPLGVKKKSYMPVVYLGLAGTLLDLLSGYDKCKDQRQALERHMASKDASGRGPASREPQAAARRQQQEQQQQQREAGAAAAAAGGQRPGA